MVDGRQYHMNTDSRQRWMDDVLRRVAAERQAVDPVTGGGWDPSVMGFDSREAMAAALAQPSVSKQRSPSGPSGFMGPLSHLLEGGQDIVNYLKNRPFASGRQVPMAGIPSVGGFGTGVPRTNLNPNAGIGDLANIGLDMAVGTLGDVGVTRDDPGHVLDKDQAIPFGRIAAAGLLPFKGIRSVAKSLIGGADETAETANRTRRMQDADDVIASRARAKQATTDYPPLPSEKPGAGLPKTVDDIFGDMTPLTPSSKKYMTEDGSVFVQKADGTLTDGDRVFNSLDDLLDKTGGNIRRYTDPPKNPLDVEPQWADDLASPEPVAQTSKISDLPPLPDTTASGRPILGVGPNRAPVTPKTDAAGRQIQGIFSGISDAMGGGALADALGPASRGVSKSIDDVATGKKKGVVKPSTTPKDLTKVEFKKMQNIDMELLEEDLNFERIAELVGWKGKVNTATHLDILKIANKELDELMEIRRKFVDKTKDPRNPLDLELPDDSSLDFTGVKGAKAQGQCYPYCYRKAFEKDETIKIVHGQVDNGLGELTPHAWIETKDGLVLDWQTMEGPKEILEQLSSTGSPVITSRLKHYGKGIPVKEFDKSFKPVRDLEFTPEEMKKLTSGTRSPGPFTSEEISKILGK